MIFMTAEVDSYIEFCRDARRLVVSMIFSAGSGHPGGSLSCVEILSLLAVEYLSWSEDFTVSLDKPSLVLSKGHACPALYAVAAKSGLLSEGELTTFRRLNSRLQGHPHLLDLPWAGSSTGSLGQGFSVALGQALGLKIIGKSRPVFALLGDGELQEGQIWEAAAVASHHQVGNLIAIVDYNKLQSDDFNKNICSVEPLADRWSSFGWHVIEINGHDIKEIREALDLSINTVKKPSVIIANTIKGKGISFMENMPNWHGSVDISKTDLTNAMLDLGYSKEQQKSLLKPYLVAKDCK